MPDNPLPPAELNGDQIKAFKEALDQWEKGNREPLRRLCPYTSHLYDHLFKKACSMIDATYDQDMMMVQEIAEKRATYVNPKNPEEVTENDRPLDYYDNFTLLRVAKRIMKRGKVLTDDKLFNPKGHCNAMCITGVFQFLWDCGCIKERLYGDKITMTKALEIFNKEFKSNIGEDFYRKDTKYLEYAFDRLQELEKLVKKLKLTPKPDSLTIEVLSKRNKDKSLNPYQSRRW